MWYIYGTKLIKPNGSAPERVYKIAHAESTDGISWRRDSKLIISDKYEHECQALPTVIKINNTLHMYFCYRKAFDFRKNRENGYRIGYAYSENNIDWTRADDQSGIDIGQENDWDSDMMCYPHLFQIGEKIFMLYNGNDFGRYGFGFAELVND